MAQNNLGDAYEYGKGVEQSYEQAFYWYSKAAEKGVAIAQHSLALFYQDGKGVGKDDDKAIYWYRQAIKNGRAEAKDDLKKFYGIDVNEEDKDNIV